MAEEDFIVRFYFDIREAERDAAKMANRLAGISAALKDVGQDTRHIDQAAAAMAKFSGSVTGAEKATSKKKTAMLGLNEQIYNQAQAFTRVSAAEDIVTKRAAEHERQQERLARSLSTTRYALYDVSSTLAIAGAALLAISVISAGTAIAYERDFANVVRTTRDGTVSMAELRKELVGLTTEIPVAFADIAKIATLGGQLGIAGNGIDDFASVVARLTATTDLSAEAAGTALGRFQALLGVPSSQFENLASAILKVGINSVATETQIVAISTQISSMADFAGFTADQVIGLAGALASVGAAPELSRGTITRTFSQISKAIANGSENLEGFARIAGVSSQTLRDSFGTSAFAGVFQSFLQGLNQINVDGGNAVIALNELGISSVRDVPLLLRLAGAGDVVSGSFRDAAEGYRLATELSDQYGIISQTTAARLQILVNSVMNFFDAMGSAATGPLKDVIDFLADAIQGITEFLSTDFGQRVGLLVVGLTALAGVLTLMLAGLTLAAASSIALRQAWIGLQPIIANLTIQTTAGSLALQHFGISAGVASVAAKGLGIAMKALTIIGAALILPDLLKWANDASAAAYGVDRSISALGRSFTESLKFDEFGTGTLANLTELQATIERTFNTNLPGGSMIGKLDEDLARLAAFDPGAAKARLDEFRTAFLKAGGEQKVFNILFTDTVTALQNVGTEAINASQDTLALADAEEAATIASEKLAAKLGLLPDELKSLESNLSSGSAGFVNFSDAASKAYGEGGAGIQQFIAELDSQIAAQQVWADNLAILTARGATGFVSELAKMGPAGSQLAADAVNLTAEELFKLEDQARLAAFLASDAFAQEFVQNTPALIEAYRTGGIAAVQALIEATRTEGIAGIGDALADVNAEAQKNPILVAIETKKAEDRLEEFYRSAAGRSVRVPIDAYVRSATGGVTIGGNWVKMGVTAYARGGLIEPQRRATGGLLRGPGSGTSDQIPLWGSNGEYMIRAASVRKYGAGLFDQLNRGVARFAGGGPIGSSAASAAMGMGITELGPKSLRVLREGLRSDMMVYLDPMGVARLAAKGNRQIVNQGGTV